MKKRSPRDVFDTNISGMSEFYERTGNVAAAWLAFSIAISQNRTVPSTILAEVERFASQIGLIAERAITASPGAASVSLTSKRLGKLWRGKYQRDPVGKLQKDWRDYQLYLRMRSHVENGMTVEAASEAVWAMKGVRLSPRSLRNIWTRLHTKK